MTRQQCACRPGCLTWLQPEDPIIQTPAGAALRAHLEYPAYPDGGDVDVFDERLVRRYAT